MNDAEEREQLLEQCLWVGDGEWNPARKWNG